MVTLHRNVSNILRGALPYLAGSIINSIAPFLISVLVSRFLGKEALGLYSMCFALVFAGMLLSDLGLNPLILREFAGNRLPETMNLRTLLLVRTCVSALTGLGIMAVAVLLFPPDDLLILGFSAFALILLRSLAGALENLLKARLRRLSAAGVTVGSSTAQVALALGILASGGGIGSLFVSMAAVEVFRFLVLLWLNRAEMRPVALNHSVPMHSIPQLLVQGLPFALIGVFTLINERSAIFFLSKISGMGEAGIYSAADRFLTVGTLIDSSLLASALPLMSLLHDGSFFSRVSRQTLWVAASIGVLGTLVLYAGAPLLMGATFRYSEATGILRILSLSVPALFCNSTVRIALFSLHMERAVAAAFSVTCALNIVLNLMVVPQFGCTGAAVVSVLSEYGMLAAYAILYLRSETRAVGSLPPATEKAA